MRLHRNLFNEVTRIDMLIAAKCDRFDLVARTSVHVVNEVNVGIVMEVGRYFGTEVALALEKIDQISSALFDQIGINRALRENGDKLFHLPSTKEWKP